MKKAYLVFCCFLLVSSAHAADESAARKFVKSSGFASDLSRTVKGYFSSAAADKALASFDFKALEEAYVKSLAKNLTNKELEALSKAYAIPGYREAMRKMPAITSEMMVEIQKQSETSMSKLRQKQQEQSPRP